MLNASTCLRKLEEEKKRVYIQFLINIFFSKWSFEIFFSSHYDAKSMLGLENTKLFYGSKVFDSNTAFRL